MHVLLSNGKMLNLTYAEDAKQGFHDKSIVVIYLTNGTKFIEKFETEQQAAEEAERIREAMQTGGGLVQKDTFDDFPKTGNPGTIYIAKDTGQTYYWDKITKTYEKTGTGGRTGVYEYDGELPTTIGATTIVTKDQLIEILKPSVDYSEGSEIIGSNHVHAIITEVNGDNVTLKTITDLTIDSFRQVETYNDLPAEGVGNVLYYVKDIDEFRIWDETVKAWVEPFHPIIFEDIPVEGARINTLYIVGDKAKYTVDNKEWILLNPDHPILFEDSTLQDAKIDTLYVVDDVVKYTKDNKEWIYLVQPEIPVEQFTIDGVTFDGVNTTFTLPEALNGKLFQLTINGLHNFENDDYTVDRTFEPNKITFDTVYDSFDVCKIIYNTEVEFVNTTIKLKDAAQSFNTEYYNKYTKKNIDITSPEFNDSIFYLEIGNYTGTTPTEIIINGTVCDNLERKISIGNSSYINARRWKVENNKLYVAVPYLIAYSLPQQYIEIIAGSEVYRIKDYDNAIEGTLTIRDCYAFGKTGYTCQAIVSGNSIKVTSGHGTNTYALVLQHNGIDILDAKDMVYRLDDNHNMGLSKPEKYKGKQVTYLAYPKYQSGPYTTASQKIFKQKLIVPGKGTITLDMEFNFIVE